MASEIRDINLAESGMRKIEWVRRNCPLLTMLHEEFSETKPFAGKKIALSIHLEAKTAYLCEVLAAGEGGGSMNLDAVAEDEAASITEAAAEKAAKIVEDAEAEARRRVAEAAEKASECERASASFRQELERAAEEARVQAERFQMYLSGRVPEAEETAMEGRGLSALIQDPPADLPEEYENPSALMHSIYKLQNREIPVEEAEEAAEYDEERVWTVDEIVAEQGEGGEEAVLADADLDSIIDDVLGE